LQTTIESRRLGVAGIPDMVVVRDSISKLAPVTDEQTCQSTWPPKACHGWIPIVRMLGPFLFIRQRGCLLVPCNLLGENPGFR
jgi:hypothetical protein